MGLVNLAWVLHYHAVTFLWFFPGFFFIFLYYHTALFSLLSSFPSYSFGNVLLGWFDWCSLIFLCDLLFVLWSWFSFYEFMRKAKLTPRRISSSCPFCFLRFLVSQQYLWCSCYGISHHLLVVELRFCISLPPPAILARLVRGGLLWLSTGGIVLYVSLSPLVHVARKDFSRHVLVREYRGSLRLTFILNLPFLFGLSPEDTGTFGTCSSV